MPMFYERHNPCRSRLAGEAMVAVTQPYQIGNVYLTIKRFSSKSRPKFVEAPFASKPAPTESGDADVL